MIYMPLLPIISKNLHWAFQHLIKEQLVDESFFFSVFSREKIFHLQE